MKIRSFLAFDIPDDVKGKIGNLIVDFQKKASGVKWAKPANLHVTLKFFGNVEEELLTKEIPKLLENGLKGQKSIKLMCEGVGVFPNWKYPRVIWAGFAGDTEAALEFQAKVEKVLEKLPVEKDKRAFRLHLTIGRARALPSGGTLMHLVEELGPIQFGRVTIDHITIYKSVLTKGGPIYTPLYRLNLEK